MAACRPKRITFDLASLKQSLVHFNACFVSSIRIVCVYVCVYMFFFGFNVSQAREKLLYRYTVPVEYLECVRLSFGSMDTNLCHGVGNVLLLSAFFSPPHLLRCLTLSFLFSLSFSLSTSLFLLLHLSLSISFPVSVSRFLPSYASVFFYFFL